MADLPDRFPDQHDYCMERAKSYAQYLYRISRSESDFEPEIYRLVQSAAHGNFYDEMRAQCPDLPYSHCEMIFDEILDRVFREGDDDLIDED